MILFNNSPQRGRALGVYFLVGAGGGAIGLFLGGFLTTVLGWEGVFFANVPIGVVAYVTGIALLPPDVQETRHGRIDIAGALAVSSSLIVALYAILDASRAGWISGQTLGLLVAAGLLVTLFARIEARASAPLMPMQLFKIRNFSIVVIAAALLAAALLACSFISALYLQIVLGSSPYEVGLALLPTNLTMAAMSLLILPSLVVRFGSRLPLLTGMVLVTLGLALLGRARIGGTVIVDVLPGMLLVGIGAGMANPPIYTTAFRDVPPSSFGAASGILNTACVMGAALGLSVVASIAAIRTNTLLVAGATPTSALHGGYRAGFYVSAGFTILASLMSGMLLHDRKQL
jgi:MFS family permease